MGYSIKDLEKAGRNINEHFERNVYFLYYRKINDNLTRQRACALAILIIA